MPAYRPEKERFFDKVNKTETCWLWTGSTNHKGYGQFAKYQGKHIFAHRWSYQYHIGDIPNGLVIDHLCENKLCVNPDHLEAVTNKENLRRGKVGQKNAEKHRSKTHCRNGHEYSDENTMMVYREKARNNVLTRRCQVCYDARIARYRQGT